MIRPYVIRPPRTMPHTYGRIAANEFAGMIRPYYGPIAANEFADMIRPYVIRPTGE